MAFAIAQPIMIQRAKFTSNAKAIAHLLFLDFRKLEALTLRKEQKFQQAIQANSRLCAAQAHFSTERA
jgi:hypothetical protein